MDSQKLTKGLQYTLQCLTAIYISLEISIPPNPYKTHLIVVLSLLICLKHDIPNKIMDKLIDWFFKWKGGL